MSAPETIERIIIDEGGFQAEPYVCSNGFVTWLIGRNIQTRPISPDEQELLIRMVKDGKTLEDWAYALFLQDIDMYQVELEDYGVNLGAMPPTVRAIVTNMAYNMGTTRFNPKKWPSFFAAVERGDWARAANEMEYTDGVKCDSISPWYRDTKTRAERLVKSMKEVSIWTQ